MKTIRLKKYPHYWVKPVNQFGSIVLEVSDDPFKIPDHITINQLSSIWKEKHLDADYEIIPLIR